MSKKILAVVAALVMSTTLITSCGKNNSNSNTSSSDETSTLVSNNKTPTLNDGYYFNCEGSFVQEFKDASFALNENDTSDLVESQYGWHIIKRLPIDMDYVENNFTDMVGEYDQIKIQKIINEVELNTDDFFDKIINDADIFSDGDSNNSTSSDISALDFLSGKSDKISYDAFKYLYSKTINSYTQAKELNINDIKNDEDALNEIKKIIENNLKFLYFIIDFANENDISLSDEENEQVKETINSQKSQYGSDSKFEYYLKSNDLTLEVNEFFISFQLLQSKIENELFNSNSKYTTSEDEFKEIVQNKNEYAHVVHILIPYECEAEITDEDILNKYDDMSLNEKSDAKKAAYNALSTEDKEKAKEAAKKHAEEILEKVNNGDDFNQLILDYGWDPGMLKQVADDSE